MLENKFFGGFESQNQTDWAIKIQWAPLLKYLEVRNNTKIVILTQYYLIE